MRQVDRVVLREIAGPWGFGVGMFTMLLMAGTYLFTITEYIVKGVSMGTVLELTALLLPGMMVKTFPMAMILATLLAFGRLSGDSEVVALRAAGASIGRIAIPACFFSLVVAIAAFGMNETIVPEAALRATTLKEEIVKALSGSSIRITAVPLYDGGKLKAILTVKDFDATDRTMRDAHLVTYGADGTPQLMLIAPKLKFENERSWRLQGGGDLVDLSGKWRMHLTGDAWPSQIPTVKVTPRDIVASTLSDLDSFSMQQMKVQIERAKEKQNVSPDQIRNLEYGYWNKIALPLGTLVFALVGVPLGIRNHRTGTTSGFWMSIVVIFLYMMLARFLAVWSNGGVISPATASFMPIVIGAVYGVIAIRRKNG